MNLKVGQAGFKILSDKLAKSTGQVNKLRESIKPSTKAISPKIQAFKASLPKNLELELIGPSKDTVGKKLLN